LVPDPAPRIAGSDLDVVTQLLSFGEGLELPD
jgi:hypothetical protein